NRHCRSASVTVSPPNEVGIESRQWRQGERPLRCVWFGVSRREQSLRRTMKPRRLRPHGVPTALAATLALAAISWPLLHRSIERELWRQFSDYNGAEVTSGSTQLSLWSGKFVARDLRIPDPARLDRDQLRIGMAKGRLSPALLLRGHLNIEKLVLEQVKADV